MINCQECREELAEFALGQRNPSAAAAIDAHLETCVVCRRELAETADAWAELPATLDPVAPPADLFAGIESQLNSPPSKGGARGGMNSPSTLSQCPLSTRERLASYAVAASLFFVLAAGGLAYLGLTPLRLSTETEVAQQALDELARRLGNVQELQRLLKEDDSRLFTLHDARAKSDAAQGLVAWDLSARQWHFYALDLPPAPVGKAYQLWLAADGKRLAGPTFAINDRGVGSVLADAKGLEPGAPAKAIVTLEPEGGSPEPTGEICLEAPL